MVVPFKSTPGDVVTGANMRRFDCISDLQVK